VTFGVLDDVKNLEGDRRFQRLSVQAEPGDAGGPVFDGAGQVAGILLSAEPGARQLPENVAFAASADALSAFLTENGLTPQTGAPDGMLAPEDFASRAEAITVLVGCWR